MSLLIRLFSTPSGFDGDARRFALNQAGHMALCALLTILIVDGPAWLLELPWWTVLVGYAVWEALQIALARAELWDSAEDVGFAWAGSLAVLHPWVLVPAVLFLLSGYLRRRA